jgi:hypothetical protein
MGGGYNYISALPAASSTIVYPICDTAASILVTSSPLNGYLILVARSPSYKWLVNMYQMKWWISEVLP